MKSAGAWIGISDQAIVAYAIKCPDRLGDTISDAIKGNLDRKLGTVELHPIDEDDEIDSDVVERLRTQPLLICANGTQHVVGIVMAFDLL